MSFIEELKRRRVFRAAFLYLVVAWGVIQASDLIMPRLGLPDWTVTFVIVAAALGFPIALVLAWLYDLRSDSSALTNNRRALAYLGSGLLRAVGGFLAYATSRRGSEPAPAAAGTSADAASIAVLPFVNMSDDRSQEYFSDGLTEELLNALTQVRALRVAARTSSFSFKGKNVPVAEIARTLNVENVLEGSVRKSGNRVRITAQLIKASDGFHLWSQSYDRELTDIFAIQEEISRSIADALQVQLAPTDSASLAGEQHDLGAYDLYLQARFLWNQRTESSLREARTLLERAIRIDPTFARAHAALADVYEVWNDYAATPDRDAVEKSLAASGRALQLDSTLAEAYATIGSAHYRSFRWQEADAAFRRAIAMKPNYSTARQWYAWSLAYTGRPDKALEQINIALSVDPLSLIVNENKGEHLMNMGRVEEGVAQLNRTLELDSTFSVGYPYLAVGYVILGDRDNALRWANRTLARREQGIYDLGQSAYVLARLGQTDRARAILKDMEQRSYFAMTAHGYLALGDTARALANLEKEYDNGTNYGFVEQITVGLGLEPLRSHPRVKALRARLGLP